MITYSKRENKSKTGDQKKESDKRPYSPNLTGIPDTTKAHFEDLSGFSFDDVKIHYNSDKPAQLQALAYTQGNQVYISPGHEEYLRHELGHVIQQKQQKVFADGTVAGLPINRSSALEKEADRWGQLTSSGAHSLLNQASAGGGIIQLAPAQNPVPHSTGSIGAWDATAHHIFPRSLLENAFNLLTETQKLEITAIATPTAGAYQDSRAAQYLQWPQKNLFIGPSTTVRAEAGEKNGFDYDASFFLGRDLYTKIKNCYNAIKPLVAKGPALKEDDKALLFSNLKNFYLLTATQPMAVAPPDPSQPMTTAPPDPSQPMTVAPPDPPQPMATAPPAPPAPPQPMTVAAPDPSQPMTVAPPDPSQPMTVAAPAPPQPQELTSPRAYQPNEWIELVNYEMIKTVLPYRKHIKDYTYFKIPAINQAGASAVSPYEEIKRNYSMGFTFRDKVITASLITTSLYIPIKESGGNKEVTAYLIEKGAPTTGYLPKKLYECYLRLNELEERKAPLVRKECDFNDKKVQHISLWTSLCKKIELAVKVLNKKGHEVGQLNQSHIFIKRHIQEVAERPRFTIPNLKSDASSDFDKYDFDALINRFLRAEKMLPSHYRGIFNELERYEAIALNIVQVCENIASLSKLDSNSRALFMDRTAIIRSDISNIISSRKSAIEFSHME